MTFLPIVARELRVAAPRRSTYWVRTVAGLSVVLVGTWFFLVMQQEPPQTIALTLFGILTGGAVLYCLLSGGWCTADCLSEEKREGTLGLLFLTDLKGYDVVLGKLAASSLNAIYGALAVVPMLAIPLLLGGVTLGEVGRMALVAINALFFSLALGMCISAMSRSALKAVVITLLLLFLFSAMAPACGFWLAHFRRTRGLEKHLLMLSPWFSFYAAFDLNYKTAAKDFWDSLLTIHALGWLGLALASLIAPRSWQDRPPGVQRLRWRERWQLWSFGTLAQRRAFREQLLDGNAFYWLAGRARLKPACVWAALGLLACGWGWGFAKLGRDWLEGWVYVLTGVLANTLLKSWVAVEAGRQLAEDRRNGTMELLLSTPLTVRNILRGQSLALRRQFLGPVVAIIMVEIFFMMVPPSNVEPGDDHELWVSLWTALLILLIVDLVALYWVGMWQGLTAKNPNRATLSNIGRILITPLLGMALVLLVLALASLRGQPEFDPGWKFYLSVWFGLGLAADLLFGGWARHKLLSEFRLAAAQRHAPRPGLWKRLRGKSAPAHPELPPVIAA